MAESIPPYVLHLDDVEEQVGSYPAPFDGEPERYWKR